TYPTPCWILASGSCSEACGRAKRKHGRTERRRRETLMVGATDSEAALVGGVAPLTVRHRARRWLFLVRREPLGVIGALIILVFFVVALAAPKLVPHDPHAFAGPRLTSPNSKFPFGTNNLGQDVLARTIYGTQVSLVVGVASVMLGTVLGTALGLL